MRNRKRVCTIDDIAIINRGKSKHRPRGDSVLYGGQYPFIQTSEIKKSVLHITEFENTYNETGLAQSKLWKKGTLCLTIAANIAETGILDFDACFPDSVVGILPYDNVADVVYVKYMMDMFKVYMQQISKGTTQDNLSLEKIRKVKFEIPTYEEQIKISSILKTYDCLIENNNKRIKILEQMALELYKEWFVRFRVPFVKLTIEGKIPKDWEYKRIDEMFLTSSGGTPARNNERYYKNGTIPWVKTGELHDSMIFETEENITEEAIKNSAAKIIEPYSLLCSMYAGVGKLGINSVEMTCSQATCVIKPVSYCSIYYLFSWLKLNKLYLENISSGAAQQNISQEIIKKIRFLCPTKEMMRAYDQIVVPMWDEILFLKKKNKILEQQRDLLLPRLMSGKLEIKESE